MQSAARVWAKTVGTSLIILVYGPGCTSTVLAEYQASKAEVLGAPAELGANWKPEVRVRLSPDLAEQVVAAVLEEGLSTKRAITVSGPLGVSARVEPSVDVKELSLGAAKSCERCVNARATLDGKVGYDVAAIADPSRPRSPRSTSRWRSCGPRTNGRRVPPSRTSSPSRSRCRTPANWHSRGSSSNGRDTVSTKRRRSRSGASEAAASRSGRPASRGTAMRRSWRGPPTSSVQRHAPDGKRRRAARLRPVGPSRSTRRPSWRSPAARPSSRARSHDVAVDPKALRIEDGGAFTPDLRCGASAGRDGGATRRCAARSRSTAGSSWSDRTT